jgi:hypothetical protein
MPLRIEDQNALTCIAEDSLLAPVPYAIIFRSSRESAQGDATSNAVDDLRSRTALSPALHS